MDTITDFSGTCVKSIYKIFTKLIIWSENHSSCINAKYYKYLRYEILKYTKGMPQRVNAWIELLSVTLRRTGYWVLIG